MIKKIRVDQLRPGMFIVSFNCGWFRHPFYRNNLKVKNERIIKTIIHSGIKEVSIDTDRGPDIEDIPEGGDAGRDIMNGPQVGLPAGEEDTRRDKQAVMRSCGASPHGGPPGVDALPEDELKRMKDAGTGRGFETPLSSAPPHREPRRVDASPEDELKRIKDEGTGTGSEIRPGGVPPDREPRRVDASPEDALIRMKGAGPGSGFETWPGGAPSQEPRRVDGPPGKAQERLKGTDSCIKPETLISGAAMHEGSEAEKRSGQTVQALMKIIRPGTQPETQIIPVSVQKELVNAKEIKREAKKIVRDIMEDIRLGKQIEMKKVDRIVGQMVHSILRNKDALTGLGKIKRTDEYTFMHSVNVGILMVTFGKHLGFDRELLKAIGIGGLLHDMGKTKVPNELLTKKGRLSEDEMRKVKKHVEHSHKLLIETTGINEISVYVAAHHHERLDGTGYPNRLKAEDINIFGQMSAIVDVYDALTSDRCYQKGILPTLALKKLYGWKEYFNKELLHQFIRCIGIYPVGSLVRLKSGLLGVVLGHNEENLLYPVVRAVYDTAKHRYIMPFDIDLLEDFKKGGKDCVASCELPEKWKIRQEAYL